jgi:ketosteroid isomerase-like protein
MQRREFLAGAGLLIGAGAMPLPDADESKALQQAVIDFFHTFFVKRDKDALLAMLTDDYLLLEDRELLDRAGVLGLMPGDDIGYERTDEFDFRLVKVHGEMGYLVYFLTSKINDRQKGRRERRFLESAVMRKSGGGWKMALLHSTLIGQQ